MILLIPYHHDRMEAQRLPIVTLSIICLNILIHVVTHFHGGNSQRTTLQREQELVQYYLSHPTLELPRGTFQKLSPDSRLVIEKTREIISILDPGHRLPEEFQAHLYSLSQEFEAALEANYFRRYGYIPARGGMLTLVTSMFLHGSLLHLLANMLFLWLSGCSMEDLWGRVLYPAFYLAGGMAAAWTHGWMFPQSTVPLIGASGAIAAVMGAFIIRLYRARIHFFYIALFFIRILKGRFTLPAYVIGPLWILNQLWWALLDIDGSQGVAFWAHIGGFGFGVAVALTIQVSGIERRLIAPSLEQKTDLLDSDFAAGLRLMEAGDLPNAVYHLRKAVTRQPRDALARTHLCKAYLLTARQKLAQLELRRALELHLSNGNADLAAQQYRELKELDATITPGTRLCHKIAEGLLGMKRYSQAADLYEELLVLLRNRENAPGPISLAKAGMQYAEMCSKHLQRPERAREIYEDLLKDPSGLSRGETDRIRAELNTLNETSSSQNATSIRPGPAAKRQVSTRPPGVSRTLGQRIRRVEPIGKLGDYSLKGIAPFTANQVHPAADGIDLHRPGQDPIPFDSLTALCVFSLKSDREPVIHADLFVAGQSRPFRVTSLQVAYRRFFSQLRPNNLDNFHRFVVYLISKVDSIFLDPGSIAFLKTRKPQSFPGRIHLEQHEKGIWRQLIGKVRAACRSCPQVYWVDGPRFADSNADIRCKSCGAAIRIARSISV